MQLCLFGIVYQHQRLEGGAVGKELPLPITRWPTHESRPSLYGG